GIADRVPDRRYPTNAPLKAAASDARYPAATDRMVRSRAPEALRAPQATQRRRRKPPRVSEAVCACARNAAGRPEIRWTCSSDARVQSPRQQVGEAVDEDETAPDQEGATQ